MAVQLDEWLWMSKQIRKYQELNRISVVNFDVLFSGDSIVEYFPLRVIKNVKTLINRGNLRSSVGFATRAFRLLFGQAVDKIFLLLITNDSWKEIPQQETVKMESIIQAVIARNILLQKFVFVRFTSQWKPYLQKRVHLEAIENSKSQPCLSRVDFAYMNVTLSMPTTVR